MRIIAAQELSKAFAETGHRDGARLGHSDFNTPGALVFCCNPEEEKVFVVAPTVRYSGLDVSLKQRAAFDLHGVYAVNKATYALWIKSGLTDEAHTYTRSSDAKDMADMLNTKSWIDYGAKRSRGLLRDVVSWDKDPVSRSYTAKWIAGPMKPPPAYSKQ